MTTIQLNQNLKKKLDLMKIHKRETYNELLERVLQKNSPREFDKESLISTIEVLSNPKTMKNISIALKDKDNKSKWISLEELEKENGL